jgi:SH3 domain protein
MIEREKMKANISGKLAFIILVLAVLPAFYASVAMAETMYVSDRLIISLREGKGDDSGLIRYLSTGEHLEVLEVAEGLLRVRTREGEEGWVREKFLTSERPRAEVIEELGSEVERLKARLEKAENERNSIKNEFGSSRKESRKRVRELERAAKEAGERAEAAEKELAQLTGIYNTLTEQSADVINLVEENDTLKAQNRRLIEKDIEILEENRGLRRWRMVWWFMAGAAVFFVGWIVGKVSRQKRFY